MFWVVWCENARPPMFKHPHPGDAKKEAERLARLNPGQSFHVLGLVGTATKRDVDWIESNYEVELPF